MKEKISQISKPQNESSNDNQCLLLIQNQVLNQFNNPQQNSYCTCRICLHKYQLKQKGKNFLRQTSSLLKLDSSKMKKFLSMLCKFNDKIYLKFQIPQICFFEKGQATKFFKSKNTGVYCNQLSLSAKKNIAILFIDRKKTTVTSNIPKQLSDLANQYKDRHIKYFSSVAPSYKSNIINNANKAQSYIFHSDNKLDGKQLIQLSRGSFQEICIVKYHQKGFELLNQKQLRQLLKSNSIMNTVDFIQAYIKPKQKQQSFFFSDYSCYDTPINQFMFQRSLIHVKVQINLLSNYSKQYMPIQQLQQYQQILKQIPQDYCIYMTYKMIHYMQLVRDVKILTLNTVWIKDQNKQICFFGLLGFDYDQIQKLIVDIDIQQVRQIMDTQLSQLERQLLSTWEKMKKKKKIFQQITPPQLDQRTQFQIDNIKNQSMIRKKKASRKLSTPR